MKSKIDIKRKELVILGVITAILEIALFLLLKGSGANFTLLAGMVSIPLVIIVIFIMFSSLENAILISLFAIPLLPLSGYIMLRLQRLNSQCLIYIAFYAISAAAMLKNNILKNIDKDKLLIKNKAIRILMAILLVVNIIFAYNKQITFMIVMLSFLPFAIYMYVIKTLKVQSRKEFLDKVIYSIVLGCVISSIPDLIFFLINWMQGQRGLRGFGPLTGNYILMYDLVALVIVLNKWVKIKEFKNKWTVLLISLLLIISTQGSRGGYFTFIAIMILVTIFNFRNWKRYIPIFMICISFLTFNVMSRPEVVTDDNIQQIVNEEDKKPQTTETDQGDGILVQIINTQSYTRQIIWRATGEITMDYPYTGVGMGNLKYFFDDYTTGKKGYTDAHNIFLNLSSEIGLPFMVLFLILLVTIGLGEFIRFFKTTDKNMKLNRLTIVVICVVLFLYGNLTGITLQQTAEIYCFTDIFILMALLTYRDCIEVNDK